MYSTPIPLLLDFDVLRHASASSQLLALVTVCTQKDNVEVYIYLFLPLLQGSLQCISTEHCRQWANYAG